MQAAVSEPSSPLRRYLENDFANIQGWCIPQLWQVIEPLDAIQRELGVRAPIAEIGVYHGKFFIGLLKTKNVDRGNFAIDVFDMQRFNLDGAGAGDLAIFKQNLDLCNVAESEVTFHRADSTTLRAPELAAIREKCGGGFSMFSVDGCHLAEHTINDVKIAMDLTIPEGIIMVDDYYNANWPGVQEGVCKLFLTSSPMFIPLAYSCNKLFLCHFGYHQQYFKKVLEHVKSNFPTSRCKIVKRFGYDTISVMPDLNKAEYITATR